MVSRNKSNKYRLSKPNDEIMFSRNYLMRKYLISRELACYYPNSLGQAVLNNYVFFAGNISLKTYV